MLPFTPREDAIAFPFSSTLKSTLIKDQKMPSSQLSPFSRRIVLVAKTL